MFDNIGKKIKTLAEVLCWIGIVSSVTLGIAAGILVDKGPVVGILLFLLYSIIGALSSWIGSFLLYGFGELIDNSKKAVVLQNKTFKALETLFKKSQNALETKSKWHCDKCGMEVSGEYDHCPFCDFIEKKERLKESENSNT